MDEVAAATTATIATNVLVDEGLGMWANPPVRARSLTPGSPDTKDLVHLQMSIRHLFDLIYQVLLLSCINVFRNF
jgi:hypothetical protein